MGYSIGLASILNVILALKTPMHRPIDVILSGLLISPEIYLWVNLVTFNQVWIERLTATKKTAGQTSMLLKTGKRKVS